MATVSLHRGAIANSGDYERYMTVNSNVIATYPIPKPAGRLAAYALLLLLVINV